MVTTTSATSRAVPWHRQRDRPCSCSSSNAPWRNRMPTMVVHVVLLTVPAAAAGFLHAFKFAVLLWPFNLTLPLLRHLPRVCATLQSVASHCAAELRAYMSGNHQNPYSSLRGVQRRSPEQLAAHAMFALVDISY